MTAHTEPLPFECSRDDVAAMTAVLNLARQPCGALFVSRDDLKRAARILAEIDRRTPKR